MRNAELAFQAKDIHLEVRTFSIEAGLSQPFEVLVTARSEASDLDLDAIVGHPAAFRLAIPEDVPLADGAARVWSGVCSHIELVQIEPDGLSTYWLRIVPLLWRMSQRRNHRVFQHVTAAEIATGLCAEWGIEPLCRLDTGALARHEYRVQYGETDLAFVSRMLEEAGLSYRFDELPAPRSSQQGERALPTMQLVLMDRPADAAKRLAQTLPFVGDGQDRPMTPFVRQVRVGHQVRPGRFTVRDYDFRSSPDLELLASARVRMALEERYELYHYQPGAFVREMGAGRGGAADARVDEKLGQELVAARLDATRSGRRTVRFQSNVLELEPGLVFAVTGHPRVELNAESGLLCTRVSIEGDVEQLTEIQAEAAFVGDPVRPALRTPKPRLSGVQSAIVVGPKGEEIYTDRFGRVRVQFHWDRVGKHDEHSSCWVRVSQAWAGAGFGIQSLPRVGQEVIVDFFEGDPDQPVVTGRVHNSACNTPYPLPEHKSKTVWKSSSTPGAAGSNELTFEDARGEELVYLHAQRNFEERVEADALETVGANLRTLVGANEDRRVDGDQSIAVAGDRQLEVGGTHAMRATGMQLQTGERTGLFCQEGKLVLTNGSTSLVLDGPNLYLDAGAGVQISAGRSLALAGQQVRIDGNPNVYINCGQALPPAAQTLDLGPVAQKLIAAGVQSATDKLSLKFDKGKMELPDAIKEKLSLAEMPSEIELPPELNEQIQKVAETAKEHGEAKSQLLEGKVYEQVKKHVQKRLDQEKKRLEKLRDDAHELFSKQRDHIGELAGGLKKRLGEEWAIAQQNWAESRKIIAGDAKFLDKCKAVYKVFDAERKRIMSLRKDLTAMFKAEKERFQGYVKEWKQLAADVRTTVDYFKKLVDDPKDAILDVVLGEEQAKEVRETIENAKETIEDVKETAEKVKELVGFSEVGGDIPAPPPDIPTPPAPPPDVPSGGAPGHGPIGKTPAMDHGVMPKTPANPIGEPHGIESGPLARQPGGAMGKGPGLGAKPLQQAPGGSIGRAPGMEASTLGKAPGSAMAKAPGMDPGRVGRAPALGAASEAHPGVGAGPRPDPIASPSGGFEGSHGLHHGTPPAELGSAAHATAPVGALHSASGEIPGAPAAGSGAGSAMSAAGSSASSPMGTAAASSGEVGSAFARRGGLAATDVASTVAPSGMSVLQTPQDGQLLVVASQSAQPLDANALTSAAVDAQMAGRPTSQAMGDALAERGYAVYERPWGDYVGRFVRVASSQAG